MLCCALRRPKWFQTSSTSGQSRSLSSCLGFSPEPIAYHSLLEVLQSCGSCLPVESSCRGIVSSSSMVPLCLNSGLTSFAICSRMRGSRKEQPREAANAGCGGMAAAQRKRGLSHFSLTRLLYASPLVPRRINRNNSRSVKSNGNVVQRFESFLPLWSLLLNACYYNVVFISSL